MASKRKRYVGRVYLGTGDDGRQLWHWVGRFERKRDRDEAVAKARTEKPWQKDIAPDEWTVDAWCDRHLVRMESGELRPASGRRYKDSSIDAIRWRLRELRKEFG